MRIVPYALRELSRGPATAGRTKEHTKVRINELLQESIKSSSAWFLACRQHAAGMVDMMLHRVQQLPDFQAQLHVIYLINDLFFTAYAAYYLFILCQHSRKDSCPADKAYKHHVHW